MKKVLIVLFLAAVLICALNDEPKKKTTYTQEELWEAIAEAEYEAYKRGYDEAEYYARGELERFKSEYGDAAFEAGYERGYEDGYEDGRYGKG